MKLEEDTPTYSAIKEMFPEKAVEYYDRYEFYEVTKSDDVALVIVTGDNRYAANVLMTICL